jgi:pectin methylesterase-like acyl-CoA thioesterase
MRARIPFYAFLTFVLTGSMSLFSQGNPDLIPSSATWPLTNPEAGGTGLVPVISGPVDAGDEYFSQTEINQYTGPEESQRIRIVGNSWPANQTTWIEGVYVEFTLSPAQFNAFHLDSVKMRMGCTGMNEFKADVFWSTDPAFATSTQITYNTGLANNYLPRDALYDLEVKLDMVVGDGESFYLRIYPYVYNDPTNRTGKYLALKDVYIGGAIESLGTPTMVEWPYTSDESCIIMGPVLAGNSTYSSEMAFYDTTTLPITPGGENVTVGAIQTVSQDWNAEPNPVDSLYIQYRVRPKAGGTLIVDSVSMYIGGWFSSNLRAAVYYSQDASFSSKTLLLPDASLVGNAVTLWQASLNDTVHDGDAFYLRIYPHNTAAEGWAKLVALHKVTIYGVTRGVTADPPEVTTMPVTYISTTFATGGGNIVTDGGAPVTARGMVWNESGSPTTDDYKTEAGMGSGSFSSQITGLTPGTLYYVRAYATNLAGTSYGQERQFTSLSAIVIPTVTTKAVSNILVKTAESGGEVTDWGGDTVKVRGLCWNTTGSPTIADNFTVDGAGIGSYNSTMTQLSETSTYYFRAYATNSAGTGYGNGLSFATQAAAPDVTKVVAKDGSGDYTTVQAAFDAVPDLYTGNYTIYVKPGVYYEKLLLGNNKVNVILRGEHPDSVILTYDDYAGIAGSTSGSYSVSIEPNDFTAYNVTFRNTVISDGSVANQQAVALRTNGDRQSYYNCKILGTQDTYYAYGGGGTDRIYMKNCLIEGSVDFIFGRDIVVFDSCEIRINRNGGTLTAAATEMDSKFGFVFRDCKITTTGIGFNGITISSFVLGRPWQQAPRTVFIRCIEPSSLSASGWSTWNVTPALYAEYECFGPGSGTSGRISISRQLSSEEAKDYSLRNIFARTSNPLFGYDWVPDSTVRKFTQDMLSFDDIPARTYGDDPFTPAAFASSGLPVSFLSADPGVATASGSVVSITGVGNVEISAWQEGNYLYYPSGQLVKSLAVSKGELTATADDIRRPFGAANPTLTITYDGFAYGDDEGDITPPDISCDASEQSPIGTYPIVLSGGSAANYNLTLVNGTLSVTDPTGAGDLNSIADFRVYPVPASGTITIERKDDRPEKILVLDVRSRVLIERTLLSNRESIDISSLPKGTYLVKVGERTVKFVMQ